MSTINQLITALAQDLVATQHISFTTTYLDTTPEGKIEQKLVTIGDDTSLPLSVVIPPRSLYMDQVTVEYVTTADATPFLVSAETVTGMKVSIQYKSNPILELQ